MRPWYDEFELTDSAYRHGYDDEDFADMLRDRFLVLRRGRRRRRVYEVFGRNRAGEYLVAAGRVVESSGMSVLRIFHLNRMTPAQRNRYRRQVRP